jgi:hypothetical protein
VITRFQARYTDYTYIHKIDRGRIGRALLHSMERNVRKLYGTVNRYSLEFLWILPADRVSRTLVFNRVRR